MIDQHPQCPQGHPLVVRSSKYGKFFGCLTYPNHKLIVERPNCSNGHIMSLRKGPYGEFFGCTEYPKCKETYNFEVKDSKYHARLWRDFENSETMKIRNAKVQKTYKQAPKFSEIKKFSKEEFNKEMKVFIEENNYTPKAKKDKNHPDFDTRLPVDLSEEERNEYQRLYESEYSNHILLKVPSHLLKEYLQKSLKFRRILN